MTEEDKDAMQHQLDEWNRRLAALQGKAAKADGLVKADLLRAIDTIHRAQSAAASHLEQIISTPPEAFNDDRILSELREGWHRVSADVIARWRRFELR